MNPVWRTVLDTLFPPLCVVCRAHLPHGAEMACGTCLARIPRFGWRLCPMCGARLVDVVPPCHPETKFTLVAASTYASR
ncbi:MAG: double zinc ribbon domain-containing protein [Candidatus Jorgensenbacteria bacterium]|nr:double zinc ribbon domain-containing protein [Candidatus Jorgensenbacteria bacterium]